RSHRTAPAATPGSFRDGAPDVHSSADKARTGRPNRATTTSAWPDHTDTTAAPDHVGPVGSCCVDDRTDTGRRGRAGVGNSAGTPCVPDVSAKARCPGHARTQHRPT